MKLWPKDKKRLLKAAPGEIPSSLLIKHIQLINVITGEIYPVNVFVYDGMIAHVEYKNLGAGLDGVVTIVDRQGHYLISGFLGAYEHIESSMMTPYDFVKAVLPHGTATVITDPHGIADVWGIESVRYMHDSGEDLPMRQLVDIPSCVSAVPGLENAGANFLAEQIEEFRGLRCVIGLVEVMDFLAVIHGEDCVMDILEVAEDRGLYMQGHIPYVSGQMLSAYLCGGPNTCHETRASNGGLEKLRSAMYVDARDSFITKNAKDIWEDVRWVKFFDHLCFCTDDHEADGILDNGRINDVIRNAIRCDMDPVTTIKSATYNTVREIKIKNLGVITFGFVTDMLPVEDLEESKLSHVFYNGELVVEGRKLLADIKDESYTTEHRDSTHVEKLSVEDFRTQAPVENGMVKVSLMKHKDLLLSSTLAGCEELPVESGYPKLDDDNLKFVAIVNRHEGHDTVALGVVHGLGTTTGALASTASRGSHDLTVIYDTAENVLLTTNKLIARGDGMCAVEGGVVFHTLQLLLAGLTSLKPTEELAVDNALMRDASRALGLVDMENPLLRIVALALSAIPETRTSDLGLIDVLRKEIVLLFV